ncbi:hypothetical protein ACFOSC_21460 [Streptantibioticus rubrisoli]|uniref:hypothetical protein n=1 Tax=Streptantibioticus rubrisoli TaxID=1387313 RepID=UPI0035591AA8
MRHETGGYLDPWHDRLKDLYVAIMADLGVPIGKDVAEPASLAAMEHHKENDPALACSPSAIDPTVKGGVGKTRKTPAGPQLPRRRAMVGSGAAYLTPGHPGSGDLQGEGRQAPQGGRRGEEGWQLATLTGRLRCDRSWWSRAAALVQPAVGRAATPVTWSQTAKRVFISDPYWDAVIR